MPVHVAASHAKFIGNEGEINSFLSLLCVYLNAAKVQNEKVVCVFGGLYVRMGILRYQGGNNEY